MLDVRRLRVLLAVSEHGGVAAAARALTFTPPAVSQHIAALERQLGVPLVDRSGRTARLTAAGHRLAGHARQVLADLEAAEADMAQLGGDLRGTIAVGTVPTLGMTVLPAAMATLRATAPGVDLRIRECEPEEGLPALARGDLDVVLAGEYSLTPNRSPAHIERIDLFTEALLIAVPSDHAVHGPDVDLAELRDERWISPAVGSSCETILLRSCALAGYEPHVVAHCGDFAVATALVEAGHGITLLPSIAVPGSREDVRLLGIRQPGVHRTLYAAIRQGTRQHPLVNCLLDVVTTTAQHYAKRGRRSCPA
ncbi:LysR family transcriptional regulator [Kibdelosporangium aridum]|uniref:LysR family transcriptional regulator n=1 Tax=Kibdelosporangium aridum TaxID=2030 RepID=A0A428ZHA1_KIBAR|nr:LysR family transcriptional regulator [Kibdelosporangium aridum]RSM87457.1 LysR family transcriptional regulator [Kibdelosporangium aridum]